MAAFQFDEYTKTINLCICVYVIALNNTGDILISYIHITNKKHQLTAKI